MVAVAGQPSVAGQLDKSAMGPVVDDPVPDFALFVGRTVVADDDFVGDTQGIGLSGEFMHKGRTVEVVGRYENGEHNVLKDYMRR